MTVLAALRCREGVVLISDSRETRGQKDQRLARNVTKIYEPRAGFVVACAGYQTVTQAFALAVERDAELSASLDRVAVQRHLEAHVKQIRSDGETDIAEWLLAWWSGADSKVVTLHLLSDGRSQWVEDWTFAGDQRPVAIATIVSEVLRFIPLGTLTLEQAKLVALKVARDTIRIGVESIGGEPQLAAVSSAGVEVLTQAQLKGLHDTLDVWEDQAAELLPGSVPVPADTSTPDRGVRPPSDPPT